mgnify:CR=1 FL=1
MKTDKKPTTAEIGLIIFGILFYLAIGTLFVYGTFVCGKEIEETNQKRNSWTSWKVKVEKVLIHRPGEYSILYLEGNKLVGKGTFGATILADVPKDSFFSWAEGKENLLGQNKDVTIHLRSSREIDGGKWIRQTGKTSTVQETTTVLE